MFRLQVGQKTLKLSCNTLNDWMGPMAYHKSYVGWSLKTSWCFNVRGDFFHFTLPLCVFPKSNFSPITILFTIFSLIKLRIHKTTFCRALHREIEFSGASVPARVLFAAVAEVCLLNMIFRLLFPVNRSENEMTQLPEMCLRKTAANDPSTHGTSPARIFIIQPCGAAIKKRLHPE